MNFNKINDLKLELDKSQSEMMLENKIHELFDFADLEAEMIDEYYNQILQPYIVSLNLNPNDYFGYCLYFYYYNVESKVCLTKYDIVLGNDVQLEFEFHSEMWNKTNQFFKNKKYEKVMTIIHNRYFVVKTNNHPNKSFFDAKNQNLWKNSLIDKKLKDFINGGHFQYFINIKNQKNLHLIKNQEDLNLQTTSINKIIRIYYKNHFVFNFSYQISKNKKEILEMLLHFKRQIEYEINVKGKRKLNKLRLMD